MFDWLFPPRPRHDALDDLKEMHRHWEETDRIAVMRRPRWSSGPVKGSGNIFADLGFENPEAELAKADARIAEIKRERIERALRPEHV